MLQRFSFGDEAVDYLQSRLWEDGDTISGLLLGSRLHHKGDVTAELPVGVDTSVLYRFRTDIFWGWPDGPGSEVTHQLVSFLTGFLADRKGGVVICESWLESAPDFEPSDSRHFPCRSTKIAGKQRLCRFLTHERAASDHVRGFLRNDNRYPLILTDLAGHPETMREILSGTEVSAQGLSAIAENAAHIIVDVYDGRASLVWSRRSPGNLRKKWEQGNLRTIETDRQHA